MTVSPGSGWRKGGKEHALCALVEAIEGTCIYSKRNNFSSDSGIEPTDSEFHLGSPSVHLSIRHQLRSTVQHHPLLHPHIHHNPRSIPAPIFFPSPAIPVLELFT